MSVAEGDAVIATAGGAVRDALTVGLALAVGEGDGDGDGEVKLVGPDWRNSVATTIAMSTTAASEIQAH